MNIEHAQQVIAAAHDRLDAAGVPSADGVICDDPTCHSKLEHRITVLIAERDRLREQPQIQRDQVMDILQRANAGWLNDYKIEISGASYIQWGKVEQDIRALFDAPNVKAVLVQQLQTWRRVGRFILEKWSTPESPPPSTLTRLLVERTQAAMDGTTEEGSL